MSEFALDSAADGDISTIFQHIAADNFSAAQRWRDKLINLFVLLARNPGMGQQRPELASGIRSISLGNYVIYFRPKPNEVEIARVVHGARHQECISRI